MSVRHCEPVGSSVRWADQEAVAALIAESDTIVATKRAPHYAMALEAIRPDQVVVDLVRLFKDGQVREEQYDALVG